jgi:hypothetical protein
MIVSKQKKLHEILESLDKDPVFIVGCSECATICQTGGEKEVQAMKNALEKNNITVTGVVVLDPACHRLNDKRLLKHFKGEIQKAKKVLVLACGNGTQTVSEILEDKDIITGTDTLFLGEIQRLTEFEKRCMICGECLVDDFGGFCPVARCPKHMLNGPCGGASNGTCEIDPDLECVWDLIYRWMKKKQRLPMMKQIQEPKDWSQELQMRRSLKHDSSE